MLDVLQKMKLSHKIAIIMLDMLQKTERCSFAFSGQEGQHARMICMVCRHFVYTSCINDMYIYTYDKWTKNNIYIYIYIGQVNRRYTYIYIYMYIFMTCDKVYIWYEICDVLDLIDKVKINRIWKHFHTFRDETWTMDRRTRAASLCEANCPAPPPKIINSNEQFYKTCFGHLIKNDTIYTCKIQYIH